MKTGFPCEKSFCLLGFSSRIMKGANQYHIQKEERHGELDKERGIRWGMLELICRETIYIFMGLNGNSHFRKYRLLTLNLILTLRLTDYNNVWFVAHKIDIVSHSDFNVFEGHSFSCASSSIITQTFRSILFDFGSTLPRSCFSVLPAPLRDYSSSGSIFSAFIFLLIYIIKI